MVSLPVFVQMERGREVEATLLNDVGHSVVIDFECIKSIILWNMFKFSRVKVMVRYDPQWRWWRKGEVLERLGQDCG